MLFEDPISVQEIPRFSAEETSLARNFLDKNGFVVFSSAFDLDAGLKFWSDVETGIASGAPLTFSQFGKLYTNPNVPEHVRGLPRIIDVEDHVPAVYDLMLCSTVRDFLAEVYGEAPTCLQTLTYKYSSEQGAHSDKTLVSPPSAINYDRESLTAAWFALERSDQKNGALIVYPGSHRLPKRGFTEGFSAYGAYMSYLDGLCRAHGSMPTVFMAEPGEILIWASDFVHAGGPIASDSAKTPTRKSLVCHYARIPSWQRSLDPAYERVPFAGASFYRKVKRDDA